MLVWNALNISALLLLALMLVYWYRTC